MQYFVTRDDFIKLEKQKKVTRQELEDLKARLNQMFVNFKRQYKKIDS